MPTKNPKTSVDVRMSPSEKIELQVRAEREGLSTSEYVRRAALQDASASLEIDLDAEELQSLKSWLDLADCDGEIEPELLAQWKAFAADKGITFAELLRRAVTDANAACLA